MGKQIDKAFIRLNRTLENKGAQNHIPLSEFLKCMTRKPEIMLRNIFQVFHDMVNSNIGEGVQEYPDDPESINFVHYDFSKLFIENMEHPFLADRLFANRFMELIKSFRSGAQQNKIYIFEGPPGCGKSTFLNCLLKKFEEFTETDDGLMYETVWHLDRSIIDRGGDNFLNDSIFSDGEMFQYEKGFQDHNHVEVVCPSHDHPLLMIPKDYRKEFFDTIFRNNKFKWKLFKEKEYQWIFKKSPCTICSSIFSALLERVQNPARVYEMVHARRFRFSRRLGEGITVFYPGDRPLKKSAIANPMVQRMIDTFFRDSNCVRYIYSHYAKTNNGIYSLMDIKGFNRERLIELHNIASEGVHKVENVEENVDSVFISLMNPEDRKNIAGIKSFADRVEYIKMPYILDIRTEVEIYRNIFGRHIDGVFLPKVMHNFARVIISSRMKKRSDNMLQWISDPAKYSKYCDKNLQLLKMEIYTGHIPGWLSEDDLKRFTAKIRRKIIAESEEEGDRGFSGRDSISIFQNFYATFFKENGFITMGMVKDFFTKVRKDLLPLIPEGFLDSLVQLYDYNILQEVKESLYYYNESKIAKNISNYLFAVNFDPEREVTCSFTGDTFTVNEEFFENIEQMILGSGYTRDERRDFRRRIQQEYTSEALTRNMLLEGKEISETSLYEKLFEKYVYNLKETVLDPFIENDNFRNCIRDFETRDFPTYDKKIQEDVTFMIKNLISNYGYSRSGAREVCMYVIDNGLASRFKDR